jgi:cytochrome c5
MKKIVQITVIGATLLSVNSAVQAFDAGASVYNSKCIICHGSGAFGAPKLGDKKAWAPRIATGMDAMLANVIKGKKDVMPPMGLCTECSESDLVDAIEFMISRSQ